MHRSAESKEECLCDCLLSNKRGLEGVGHVVKVNLGGHDGALASDEASVDDAADGEHSKAAVLELSKLVAGEGSRVLAETEGVEAIVAGLAARGEHGFARQLEVVGKVLNDTAEGKDLPEAASGNLEESFCGNGVRGCLVREVNELLHDGASDSKHGNAAVLELRVTEPVEGVLGREAKGVETNITNHGTVKGSRASEEGNGGGVLLHLHACHITTTHATQPLISENTPDCMYTLPYHRAPHHGMCTVRSSPWPKKSRSLSRARQVG